MIFNSTAAGRASWLQEGVPALPPVLPCGAAYIGTGAELS